MSMIMKPSMNSDQGGFSEWTESVDDGGVSFILSCIAQMYQGRMCDLYVSNTQIIIIIM